MSLFFGTPCTSSKKQKHAIQRLDFQINFQPDLSSVEQEVTCLFQANNDSSGSRTNLPEAVILRCPKICIYNKRKRRMAQAFCL